MEDTKLIEAMHRAYTDFYDNPRRIHYTEITKEYGTDELSETDILADVIDLGVRHQENDVEKLDVDELLHEVESWG